VETIVEIAKQIGGPYLLYLVLIVLVFDKLGIVKGFLEGRANHREQHAAEQTRIVTEQQRLLENLREEIDIQRRRRAEDETHHETEIAEITERLGARIDEEKRRADQMVTALRDEQLTTKRLRHLIGQIGTHIQHQRLILERNGIEPPRFDWSRFVAEGGDPAEFDLDD
jgi:hypothetical protein